MRAMLGRPVRRRCHGSAASEVHAAMTINSACRSVH